MPRPKIWCLYDRCHEFVPGSHNGKYCKDCKCKRKREASAKRLTAEVPVGEELWKLQENRKIGRFVAAQAKNEWLLENRTFGSFDLETTNLDASIGMILCGCIKNRGSRTLTCVATRDEDGLLNDKQVCINLRDAIEGYDYIYSYYGTKFDLPYLNTRLIIHGERPINQIRHIDLYYVARYKLKLHSNALAVVGETLFGDSGKSRVMGPIWARAAMGSKEDMDYIIEHCEKDVVALEKVFEELRGFVNLSAVRWRRFGASY
jgi:uncharacterized protein YprB with RNaseH-like and TPR domain